MQTHTFHIPVMGLAYTIDTPIKVARYGINSVISIIEDKLIELMRRYYYQQSEKTYTPITSKEEDYRARRITDYLNLVNVIVSEQIQKLRTAVFETGSEITKYFEMLPGNSPLRLAFEKMLRSTCDEEKQTLEEYLRSQITPGRIDVNIMTKVDKNNYDKNGQLLADSSDALAALRGYARSALTNSSIVFSAGLNLRLFNYVEKFDAFHARGHGQFDKEIVIKVSDYRSALVQGKYLAKKGLWVSEFRIESGLNCGGHAFATDGGLIGPILDEFKGKRSELIETLHKLYQPAAMAKGIPVFDEPHPLRVTVQGGVGTFNEASFLVSHYDISSVGWGTPFLLCPEATTVDNETLNLLRKATDDDLELSHASPLGVRFNYLKGTTAQRERLLRVTRDKPGSPCTEKHLVSNTEFTKEPICTASHTYQKKKIEQLRSLNLPKDQYLKQYDEVVSKECLCIGLSNSAILAYDLPRIKKLEAVTVCPGPNIAYFDKVVTLKDMTDHIYGRSNLIDADKNRPHMFIKELILNVEYLKEQALNLQETDTKTAKDLLDFSKNLLDGISYYRELATSLPRDTARFEEELTSCEREIHGLVSRLKGLSGA
jgi:hypothetical protein